jgi:hypothetical protein
MEIRENGDKNGEIRSDCKQIKANVAKWCRSGNKGRKEGNM